MDNHEIHEIHETRKSEGNIGSAGSSRADEFQAGIKPAPPLTILLRGGAGFTPAISCVVTICGRVAASAHEGDHGVVGAEFAAAGEGEDRRELV